MNTWKYVIVISIAAIASFQPAPSLCEIAPGVPLSSSISGTRPLVADSEFRRLGKRLGREELSALRLALIGAMKDPSSQERIHDIYDVVGHVHLVDGVDIHAIKDIFDLAPVYLIAGLSENATPEILPTVVSLQKIVHEALSKRTVRDRIDAENESNLIKQFTAYNAAMREGLELTAGDIDLSREMCMMAMNSPFVHIRWHGMAAFRGLILTANGRGTKIMPDELLWTFLHDREMNERQFLNAAYGDFIVSPRESREIIEFVNEIRDGIDPQGRQHFLSDEQPKWTR